jgi:competence protein ComEA
MFRNFIAALLAVIAVNAFAAVDANQASRTDLETVRGIGPSLSAKIVKARETGSFKSWADLVARVGGIGSGNAARLSKSGLTVQGAGFDASAIPAAHTGKKSVKARSLKKVQAGAKSGV